jgi:hypothetical protein
MRAGRGLTIFSVWLSSFFSYFIFPRLTEERYMSKIPIPNASTTEREAISKLVQKCLDAKGVGCEEWEKEIDDRVAALYGL